MGKFTAEGHTDEYKKIEGSIQWTFAYALIIQYYSTIMDGGDPGNYVIM